MIRVGGLEGERCVTGEAKSSSALSFFGIGRELLGSELPQVVHSVGGDDAPDGREFLLADGAPESRIVCPIGGEKSQVPAGGASKQRDLPGIDAPLRSAGFHEMERVIDVVNHSRPALGDLPAGKGRTGETVHPIIGRDRDVAMLGQELAGRDLA